MSTLVSGDDLWTFFVSPKLPGPISYLPLVFRILAILLAAPFAVGVALDLIAYAIARTLNISASSQRVPRSPPRVPRDLQDDHEDEWGVPSAFTAGLESRQLSPTKTHASLPSTGIPTRSSSRLIPILAVGVVFAGIVLQCLSIASKITTNRAHGSVSQNEGALPIPTALVLTAHPDDEVMFFAPTILNLVAAGWGIVAICLSDGNAAGLGDVRREELYKSYERLGVSSDNLTIISNPNLQDSMNTTWNAQLIADLITPHIATHSVTHLVTFDSEGVTQHPNHVSLAGVHSQLSIPRPRLLQLQSPSIATKFTGPVGAVALAARDLLLRADVSPVELEKQPRDVLFIASPSQYVTAIQAMLAHSSQLEWFRWLYISFSYLMWANQLTELPSN